MRSKYVSITKILQDAIDELVKPDDEVRLRPSTIGSCPRQVYFAVLQGIDPDALVEDVEDEDETSGMVAKGFFVSGIIHEMMLKNAMAKAGFHYQCYVVITPEENPPLYGHCDFFKYDEESEECYIVDIKTTSIKSKPYLPQPRHIAQVMLYLHGAIHGEVWLEDEQGNLVKKFPPAKRAHGCIFYIIRENPSHVFDGQEYWFDYDEEEAAHLLAHKRMLESAIQNRKEPAIPKGYTPVTYPCMYVSEFSHKNVTCPFWRLCWKESLEKQAEDIDTHLRSLGEELVKLYIEREKINQQYDALVKQLRDVILKDFPYYVIYTPWGEIRKTTYTRRYVRWKEVVNMLVDEGLVSRQDVEKIISQVETTEEISTIRIKGLATALSSSLFGEDEENGDNEIKGG